jgi:integration host factor subunit beta
VPGAVCFGGAVAQKEEGSPVEDQLTRRNDRTGMTKAELVEEVARSTQLTKRHAEVIVNTVFESIVDSLKDGEKIELRGFGSFRIRERNSRVGRNPKTGDRVNVPSKRVPYFKPGKQLKELLNGSGRSI